MTDSNNQQRGNYGRNESRRKKGDVTIKIYEGQTYYGRPALKKSIWGWWVVVYLFVGGLSGAAQVIATIADLVGRNQDRSVVRAGRYTALAGALLSPVLLIADLHTPQRWYNMIRIFRKTSAMSIGSWTLVVFGGLTGLTAVAQALDDFFGLKLARTAARVLGIPAALFGMMMTVYTGTLLSATSVPLWVAVNKRLSSLFGASSVATGASTLSLILVAAGAPRRVLRRLERLALLANAVELGLSIAIEREWKRQQLDTPLQHPTLKAAHRYGEQGLGAALPIMLHSINMLLHPGSRTLAVAAAVSTLIGSFCQRAVMVFGGNMSAERPEDYFRFTQPGAPDAGKGSISATGSGNAAKGNA